ncbi:MAG: TIM barrel protein [Treponema sp.]|jgi:hydroxypyruvate isomerase|nr:TIM barrel protein [Treponema sp.]
MKFSLCIEPVFTDVDFYDRIQLAKECGADAVELWDPSQYDSTRIGKEAAKNNIPVAAIGFCRSWDCRLNDSWPSVRKELEETILKGKDIGCGTFIGLSGEVLARVDHQKMILIENLKRAADLCEKNNVTIVLEALNSLYDHKGYYLDSSYVAFEIVRAVNNAYVKVLFDCYHMQIMEGNLVNNIKTNIDFIGHFHSAAVPGRHEHNKGETDYPFVIHAAEEAGYDRYFGLEYWPTYDNKQSVLDVLDHVRRYKNNG